MKLLIHTLGLLIVTFLGTSVRAASIPTINQNPRRSSGQCAPFHSAFQHSDISSNSFTSTPFVAVSPRGSYNVGSNGLELYLEKPNKPVKMKDGVNDFVAEGATVNSTFSVLYGKISFELSAPTVPGVVTAAIMLADQHDEIDIELLGGDTTHWQSNIFTTSPKIRSLSGSLPKKTDIESTHTYTIDWNEDRIVWSVDESAVRTLRKSETKINGSHHFPSHPARIQLGIWDASNPAGTAEWARGPIEWSKSPHKMAATFKSVTVECPY
ncbi:glycosyl hydrolases family 16-domain-containing protein [Irpex rosettiformis]|uniref:Glycosyl hydrolases family 16-domain-containing protein n=1 Tax=Irpex rosettiformis TaxID=378272 RepID=A0ACB8TV39_9APHY|nr:glycosyl hydrolases family 16-domain-containing protein [Irpex rosettiformis]